MRSIGDFLLYLKVRKFLRKEEKEVERLFHGDKAFESCDKALCRAYRFTNPYRTCRKFFESKGEKDVDLYGETPLTVLEKIAKEGALSSQDHLFELGCGRGRGSFFLAHRVGCKVTGVEWVPEFVERAQKINKNPRLSFRCEDMQSCDFKGATAIYLYGTCLEDDVIHKLIASFKKLAAGTQFITVSYSLTDYDHEAFSLIKEFSVDYPWGEAQVFLQIKRNSVLS